MDTVAVMDAWTNHLLGDASEWPEDLPNVDLEELTFEWASAHISMRLGQGYPYLAERWLSRMDYGPIPIGRQAIESDPLLKIFHRLDREILSRLALLPGREHLDIPITCTVNDTTCELLLVRDRCVIPPGSRFQWRPMDLAYRITGYPEDPDVQQLIKNARQWWREKARLPFPRGGRPRTEVDFSLACRLYLELEERSGKPPANTMLSAEYSAEIGKPLSTRTLERRMKEWKRSGLQWPPQSA